MRKIYEFPLPNGGLGSGYMTGESSLGLVLLHEWWGLTEDIKQTADQLAEKGYRVLCPDLYRGSVATTPKEAQALALRFRAQEAISQEITGAVQCLQGFGKVALLGFCMGGALTFSSSLVLPSLHAAICFYGLPHEDKLVVDALRVPFLGHFAQKDRWCSPHRVAVLAQRLEEAKADFEIYHYEAEHAFCNPSRTEVYHPEYAALAWERSFLFLQRCFGRL